MHIPNICQKIIAPKNNNIGICLKAANIGQERERVEVKGGKHHKGETTTAKDNQGTERRKRREG